MGNGFILLPVMLSFVGPIDDVGAHEDGTEETQDKNDMKKELNVQNENIKETKPVVDEQPQ